MPARKSLFVALLLGPCLGGCSSGLTAVEGEVFLDGKPYAGATVNFVPRDEGRTAAGKTDDQGKFRLFTSTQPGAEPGSYKVLIFPPVKVQEPRAMNVEHKPDEIRIILGDYGSLEKTPLEAVVPAASPLKFELKTN